jgi:hypothetical protein
MTFLAALWGRVGGWLAAAGAVLLVIAGAFLKGRRDGKAVMAEEQERHRREAIANKRKLDSEIDSLAPADLDSRFQKWTRKS